MAIHDGAAKPMKHETQRDGLVREMRTLAREFLRLLRARERAARPKARTEKITRKKTKGGNS